MRDLTVEELGHVYGAGHRGKSPKPPTQRKRRTHRCNPCRGGGGSGSGGAGSGSGGGRCGSGSGS